MKRRNIMRKMLETLQLHNYNKMTRYQNDKTSKIEILEFYILLSAATFRPSYLLSNDNDR
jgi:hypothetical protein